MFRRATACFLTVLMLWHGLAMSLLGADTADAFPAVHQVQDVATGELAAHYVDDQPGQLLQLQASDTYLGSWHLNGAVSLPHLPPLAPKDVIHQPPWLDGLHRPPNTAQAVRA